MGIYLPRLLFLINRKDIRAGFMTSLTEGFPAWFLTHLQLPPQTYRFIAPRPAASDTSIQQSTLPCQHSTNGLKNIREKLLESPKPVETPLKRSHEFPTTTSNRPMVDWIERVRTLNECEHLFRLKLLVLKSVYGSLSMAITVQYRKLICHGTIQG